MRPLLKTQGIARAYVKHAGQLGPIRAGRLHPPEVRGRRKSVGGESGELEEAV